MCKWTVTSFHNCQLPVFQGMPTNSHLPGTTCVILPHPVSPDRTRTPTPHMAIQNAPTRPPTQPHPFPILTSLTMTEVLTGPTRALLHLHSLTHPRGTWLEWVLHPSRCPPNRRDRQTHFTTRSPVPGTDTPRKATIQRAPSLHRWGLMSGWVLYNFPCKLESSKFCKETNKTANSLSAKFVCMTLRGRHTAVLSTAWTTCTNVDRSCCPSWRRGRSSPLRLSPPPPLFLIPSPAITLQRSEWLFDDLKDL